MAQSNDSLQERLGRWTLILGVCQITVGCLVGFIPPSAVPWFRGIVMSHIEYTANGVLMIAFGFLLKETRLGSKGLWTWFASLQLDTWTNGTAGLVGGLLGYSSAMMPTINEKFPAPRGLDHPAVTGLLQLCGVTMMAALFLTLYGLFSRRLSRN